MRRLRSPPGARGGQTRCSDVVLSPSVRPWCSGTVLGPALGTRCLLAVLGHGARPLCVALVLGCGAQPGVQTRCLVVVCRCSAAVRRLGAQPGAVSAVFGPGARPRRSAVLRMWRSATACERGARMWCSAVVLRAAVSARPAGAVLAQMVLRRCPQSRCLTRVHGHGAWARCVDVVLRNSCSGVVLARRSPTLCLNVVLRRGTWTWCPARCFDLMWCRAQRWRTALSHHARRSAPGQTRCSGTAQGPGAHPLRCLDPLHPNTVLAPPGPGAPFPPWIGGLWLRRAVAGDSWASRFSHLFISFPPPRSPCHFFFGFHWCYFFPPLGSRELRGQQPPVPQTKANTSTPQRRGSEGSETGANLSEIRDPLAAVLVPVSVILFFFPFIDPFRPGLLLIFTSFRDYKLP